MTEIVSTVPSAGLPGPNPELVLPANSATFGKQSPAYLNDMALNQLHHYVGPENVPELKALHRDAYSTAMFYLTTILSLYLCGLLVILIHYMNSSYGKWAWTLNDVWDELRYKKKLVGSVAAELIFANTSQHKTGRPCGHGMQKQ